MRAKVSVAMPAVDDKKDPEMQGSDPFNQVQQHRSFAETMSTQIYRLWACSAHPVLRSLGLPDHFSREVMVFGFLLTIVIAISVHDAVLIVVNHQIITDMEQNPIGVWLLDLHDGSVWPFVFLKLAGTSLVGTVLITIYRRHKKIALGCTVGLAAIQVALLWYLSFV